MLRRKCVDCLEILPVRSINYHPAKIKMIEWQTNPFGEEIAGDFTKYWLCDDCAYDSYMDI